MREPQPTRQVPGTILGMSLSLFPRLLLGHLLSSEQLCLQGRGGGRSVGETRVQSLKAKISLNNEKPLASQPGILGSARPVGHPPCGHRIPASKSLPASCWVNLVFEEGELESDAGLVGSG